ncbi:MAG TPA: RHS repeat-associated core domain-containing protein [Chthoniobacterales bacterium]
MISTVRFDSNNNQVGATNFTYDAHGRLRTQTDARMGTTTTTYDIGDQVASVSAPNPSGSGAPLVTVYDYDLVGRRTGVQLPDGTWTYTVYDFRGNVGRNYGSKTYDVSYTFDSQNRMKTMTTMSQAGNAVTTWDYDAQTGHLLNKRYADSKGPSYAYTLGGRLSTRTWARLVEGNPLVTTYGYNAAGELASVDYSDSTPDVNYAHDRLGRTASVSDATGTRTFAYRPSDLQIVGETIPAFDRVLTRKYDGLGRDAGFSLGTTANPTSDHEVSYGYDAAGRFNSVTDAGGIVAIYDYQPFSSHLSLSASYTWGVDLSGTLQGAGGVGGLLSSNSLDASVPGRREYTFDGNGNVSELLDASGVIAAHYEYSPFGETTTRSGAFADQNSFCFSTKFLDVELGLLYYGYRYYSPRIGRWINRDPIEEEGGANLYAFVLNAPTGLIDPLGLDFIAVGVTTVVLRPIGDHWSLHYFKQPCTTIKEGDRFNPDDLQSDSRLALAEEEDWVQLSPEWLGYHTWILTPPSWTPRRFSIPISFISTKGSPAAVSLLPATPSPREFAVVYADDAFGFVTDANKKMVNNERGIRDLPLC